MKNTKRKFTHEEWESKRKFYFPDLPQNLVALAQIDYSHIEEIKRKVMNYAVKAREDQIIAVLNEHGFEFKTRIELEQFAKTRCTIEKYPNQLNALIVDGTLICEWNETHRFENDGNTFRVIIGE